MKETNQDVLELLKDDTPENRQAFEEKYGAFAIKVLTTTLIDSVYPSNKIPRSIQYKLTDLIASYDNPDMVEPLIRAYKLHVVSAVTVLNIICKYDHKKATQFLISLMDSETNRKTAKTYFKKYPFHLERLKTLKPELVDVVLADDPTPERKTARCYKCNRSEDEVKMMYCHSCGRAFCVDHNYFNGHCSMMCAK